MLRAPAPPRGWDAWAALETLQEVAAAVLYLHQHGVVHADIKVVRLLEMGSVCAGPNIGFIDCAVAESCTHPAWVGACMTVKVHEKRGAVTRFRISRCHRFFLAAKF